MKKLIFLLSIFSILFFSCASKEASENIQPEVFEPIEENVEESIENENTELKNDSQKSFQIEETEETSLSEEDYDYIHQELEEIIEPDVITLEPSDKESSNPTASLEEPVIVENIDDTLPEIITEDTTIIPEINTEIIPEPVKTPEVPVKKSPSTVKKQPVKNDVNDEVIALDKSSSIETETEIEDEIENSAPEIASEIIPSRSVTLKKTEYLDITYPGTGWIYMGITDDSKDIIYFGRKVGTENTVFSVLARNAGTKILHFYKNDPVTNTFIDDYLEVIILDEKGSNKNHIQAPQYISPVKSKDTSKSVEKKQNETQLSSEKPAETKSDAKQITNTNKTASSEKIVNQKEAKSTEEKIVEEIVEKAPSSSELLEDAKKFFNEKNYSKAYEKICKYLECETNNVDEALYIKAQILESKSELQNINEALNLYTLLTKNYPSSKYWDNANKRIIYLKRFYLEGR